MLQKRRKKRFRKYPKIRPTIGTLRGIRLNSPRSSSCILKIGQGLSSGGELANGSESKPTQFLHLTERKIRLCQNQFMRDAPVFVDHRGMTGARSRSNGGVPCLSEVAFSAIKCTPRAIVGTSTFGIRREGTTTVAVYKHE